jgi:uncharacterized membrane protein YsdA (DUF1294 family)
MCAKRFTRFRRETGMRLPAILLLVLLLIIPVYALSRISTMVSWPLLVGPPVVVSIFAYFLYRSDKRRAEAGARRIPETTLHLIEFWGGWPGAFLAQRQFRHKISKLSYQISFWIIVAIHQLAALDFLMGWKIFNAVLRFLSGGHFG